MKNLLIISGPNGAGKSTFALNSLSKFLNIIEFVNADEIAKGISPLNPESANIQAGKVMLERIKNLLVNEKSFAFETTLSGKNYLKFINEAKKNNYKVYLIFLWLPSSNEAIKRVKNRVSQGGHNIPTDVIKRRYKTGLKNLIKLYVDKVDVVKIINGFNNYQNLEDDLIAEKIDNNEIVIYKQDVWKKILKVVND